LAATRFDCAAIIARIAHGCLSDNGASVSTIFDGLSDLVRVKLPPPPELARRHRADC
jgi:hypothetical protein